MASSSSEVGHNKNVANLSSGIQILEEMGTRYNPSNTNIQLVNLMPIKIALGSTITLLNTKSQVYKNAVASREIAIEPLGKRTTKILNYAKSITISTLDKENIASQVKKIRGYVKTKTVNPETSETEGISTSQMSYDSRIANFDILINQLSSHSQYIPNEEEIQLVNLQAYHQELITLSSLVNSTGNALITARKDRNNILYFNENNIIKLMREVKAYLKSLGQSGLPYYKAFVKLKFKAIQP
jgi:hypothetical protein